MSVGVMIIIAVLLVLGVGLLVFWLMRRSQTVVPQRHRRGRREPRQRGRGRRRRDAQITEAQEPPSPARDAAAFENLLKDEIHDQGREEPAAPDED